jgi:monoamine oxidase
VFVGVNKSVLIIGGGMAGLSGSLELLRRGYRITVLEAKHRFGGRIHTVHSRELPIELGAEFLHGRSEHLARVIQEAQLSLHDVPDRNQVLENGRQRTIALWEHMAGIIHRIHPHAHDRSFREFLDTQKVDAWSRRVALRFVEGFHAAHPDRISAHALLRAEYAAEQMEGDRQSRISAGYSALVDWLVIQIRALGGNLMPATVVRVVRWKQHNVEIIAEQDGIVQKLAGDAAVVTLPLGVLKQRAVQFSPALSAKDEPIDALQFGNVVKIALVFRRVWWPEPDFGFIHAFDQPIPTWWSDSRGAVLTGWAGGPKADALLAHSPPQLEALAIELLSELFGEDAAALRAHLAESHAYNWAGDPHVRGAYSYIPVNGLDLPKRLGAPLEGTLFFAGEATAPDAQTGTVFTAFESGLRVAREIAGDK